jgi:hypothetical protein
MPTALSVHGKSQGTHHRHPSSRSASRTRNFSGHGAPEEAIDIHPHESLLARARQQQRSNPSWRERYRATRPKVERKLAHLMRRKHGGRRARTRGQIRIAWGFALLALGPQSRH